MKDNWKKKPIIVAAVIIVICAIVFSVLAGRNSSTKRVAELLDLGNKYLTEQDYEQAIVTFQEVIKIDPKCEEAYLRLADAYIGMGDYETACDVIKKGVEQTGSNGLESYLEEIEETYTGIQEKAAAEAEREEKVGNVAKTWEEDKKPNGQEGTGGNEREDEGTDDVGEEEAANNAASDQNENGDVPDQAEESDQDDRDSNEPETTPAMKVIDETSLKDEARRIFDSTGSMTEAEEIFDNALAAQNGNKYACDQIELARMWFYQQLYNGYHEQIVAAGNGISSENLEYGQRILYYEIMKLSCYELGDIDKYNEYDWLGYKLCVEGSD